MTEPDFSKAALTRFLTVAVEQGLLNPNTAAGLRAACMRILEDVADTDDVRKVDVKTAVRRYHNKHPGELKGTVLAEYERRLKRALADFTQYTEDPTTYKGRGRGPTDTERSGRAQRKKSSQVKDQTITPLTGAAVVEGSSPKLAAVAGLSLEFPMRTDFLAQVVVPRDMKAEEARRLSRFIMTLAMDYAPKESEV